MGVYVKNMENKVIKERLAKLRGLMKENGIDYYLVPTDDFHGSEYVNDYFKVREFLSGFTGSAGTLLVYQNGSALWTDGRYFIQAASELEGTGVDLMKMREEGVPTLEEFIKKNIGSGETLGFDGRVIPAQDGLIYEKILLEKNAKITYDRDLADEIWENRPAFPAGKIYEIPEKVAGKSIGEKLEMVRYKLSELGAESLFLTKLDDIMWLFNIRGCDVECNPVAISYAYVSSKEAVLFIQKKILTKANEEYFERHGVSVVEYEDFAGFLKDRSGEKMLLDQRYCSYSVYKLVKEKNEAENGKNPTELLKAVKNPTELEMMKKIYMEDNVALTKFIYWLKTNIGKQEITEISASDKLEEFRRQIPEFIDLSFPTIAGYGPNAAMMHYEATPESFAVLDTKGFLLVDSGGQYMGGTTDVTRTMALGALTEEEIYHYTLVAAGMIQMTNAKFLYGCTGRNLDILAREPLWAKGLDYKCGTGHGVGYILNVHEGPQSLRWQYNPKMTEAIFEEGMDVTNEQGIYVEGSHGIRIENVMVAKRAEKNEYGQFMNFETLTYVPLDRNAIDVKFLTDQQREWINAYQKQVYEKLSPYLTKEECEWLKAETAEI